MSVSLLDAISAMRDAGLSQTEIAEILARTRGPRKEDEYVVIKEVLDREAQR